MKTARAIAEEFAVDGEAAALELEILRHMQAHVEIERHSRAERVRAVLRKIESMADAGISKYGITQQPKGAPEAWTTRTNAVIDVAAPIRDEVRKVLSKPV